MCLKLSSEQDYSTIKAVLRILDILVWICLWQMNPDPDSDPAIFVIDLQDANKK